MMSIVGSAVLRLSAVDCPVMHDLWRTTVTATLPQAIAASDHPESTHGDQGGDSVLCRDLNSMDVILHQVGRDLLLNRRKDLHAAHRLQRLPQLHTHKKQCHTEPAVDSNRELPGCYLQAACHVG